MFPTITRTTRRLTLALALIACLVSVRRAPAADVAHHLGGAIPQDVHVYMRWQNTPQQAFLRESVSRAWQRLADSGIHRDLIALATDGAPERRQQIENAVERLSRAFTEIGFEELLTRETAVGMRLAIPFPEYVFLFRTAPGEAEKYVGRFRHLFDTVVSISGPFLGVTETATGGYTITTLGPEGTPFGIEVASTRGDVLALGISRSLIVESLDLASGKRGETGPAPIVESQRYATAMAGFREKRDTEVLFDLTGYIGVLRGMLGMARNAAGSDEHAVAALGVIDDFFGEMMRLGTVAEIGWAEANRLHAETRLVLRDDFRESPFHPAFASQKPISSLFHFAPLEASGFIFSSGVDLAALYDLAEKTVRERIPDGQRLLDRWREAQDAMGFHPRADILSWLEGAWGWISFPGKTRRQEHVLLLRVRDADVAAAKIDAGFQLFARFAKSRGQPVRTEPVDRVPGTFREVHIDAFPDCHPVYGFSGNVLLVGTSADAVAAACRTRLGERACFQGIEGFKLQTILQDAKPHGVHYIDVEDQLRGLAQILTGAGFFLSMAPEERETRPLIRVGAILTKLGRFVRDVDLALETASWTTFDAEHGRVVTHSVTSFKNPERRAREF